MTTQTLTLVTFLSAMLDTDEAVARDAITHGEGSLDWADEGDPTDRHIARHDPARVLADVEAKRRIWLAFGDSVAQWLALPYADHPDFNEAWRPE